MSMKAKLYELAWLVFGEQWRLKRWINEQFKPMTNKLTDLQTITAAVHKALPEKKWTIESESLNGLHTCDVPITIADVLVAVKMLPIEAMYPNERHPRTRVVANTATLWNCRKDDIRDQSPECLAFISSILSA